MLLGASALETKSVTAPRKNFSFEKCIFLEGKYTVQLHLKCYRGSSRAATDTHGTNSAAFEITS